MILKSMQRCHTSVMLVLGCEARATGNGVRMNATLEFYGCKIRFPACVSAAQQIFLRHHIQAIKSYMIVNCFPGAPVSNHHS